MKKLIPACISVGMKKEEVERGLEVYLKNLP